MIWAIWVMGTMLLDGLGSVPAGAGDQSTSTGFHSKSSR